MAATRKRKRPAKVKKKERANMRRSAEDHVIHDHPVPPEEISRYSPTRDVHSEKDISDYMEWQAPDEKVQHVEKVKTEYVMGTAYAVWDVTTNRARWWVITNATNLYSQKYFPSLDYTLSFHIGLMARMQSRPEGASSAAPTPFDEVFRRQSQAKDKYDRAVEAEDYQAVGMQLRECLLTMSAIMQRRVEIDAQAVRPKAGAFIEWNELLMNTLCGGAANETLRKYMKAVGDKTWQLVNHLTHSRNATEKLASISIAACGTLVGHSVQLLVREELKDIAKCPKCGSRHIRQHFDNSLPPDGEYFNTCGECGWDNHPGPSSDSDGPPHAVERRADPSGT